MVIINMWRPLQHVIPMFDCAFFLVYNESLVCILKSSTASKVKYTLFLTVFSSFYYTVALNAAYKGLPLPP